MAKSDLPREKTMRYSIVDGSLWAVMYYIGTRFLTPFAVALRAPIEIISALNASGSLMDGVGEKFIVHFSPFGWQRKKVTIFSVFLQSLCYLLLSLVAYLAWQGLDRGISGILLVALAALSFFFGGTANPPWIALMGDVVPSEKRASWFGFRSRIQNFVALAAVLCAGLVLGYAGREVLLGFALLFFFSFTARLAGAYFLGKHIDPHPGSRFTASGPAPGFRTFCIIQFLLYFTLTVGSPFIDVYYLGVLGIGYLNFSLLLLATLLIYSLSYYHWGRLIEHYGPRAVLVSSTALLPISILSVYFVTNAAEAQLANLIGTLAWGGVLLSTYMFVLDNVAPRMRSRATGDYSIYAAFGAFFGTLLGGALLSFFGTDASAFRLLFIITAVARILVPVAVHFLLKENVQPKKKSHPLVLMTKIVTIYPLMGLAHDFQNVAVYLSEKTRASRCK
ncbi:MAG: MFS transporter [Candidatus ainarchaeum sp.]|nr:MFS transporter [Candidatus ainarchaeum sp.]